MTAVKAAPKRMYIIQMAKDLNSDQYIFCTIYICIIYFVFNQYNLKKRACTMCFTYKEKNTHIVHSGKTGDIFTSNFVLLLN